MTFYKVARTVELLILIYFLLKSFISYRIERLLK